MSHTTPSKKTSKEKGKSYLEIFAGNKQDADKVIKEIEKDVADQCKQKVIERDAISRLSKQQKRKMKDLEVKHDAVVTIEEAVGRISIRGDAEDVLDVTTTIHEILNQQIEEEHTRGVEELVSKNTQWFYYDDDGSLEPYDTSINLQIEKAFGDGRNSVVVLIDEFRYKIVFKDMKETCLDDREERLVVRKEIGKVDHSFKEIEKYVADQCKQKVIERDAISRLSKQQKRKIKDLEVKHDASVIVEEAVGRISIRGDVEDVLDVTTTIHEILNQQIEEEHTRGVEELVSKNTQWFYYDDDGSLEPYDTSINLQIEKAFGDGRNSVVVLIDEFRYKIVFKDMKETCLDDREERLVVRKEIGKGIPLPIEWGMHPKDSSGKEKEVHLVPLDPVSDSNEYKKVEDKVRKTSNVTITKIERVQNPPEYRRYMVRKKQMEQKKGSNEKILFHGTAVSSCACINKFGFNRSYCGKNETVYGNGVYFARDASYSTQFTYSPPDRAGNRYMYLARILVGEYTPGRRGMITPPPKGSDATDVYDTVVDNPGSPSIFVVFYDNQCYPDYLITFK